MKRSTWLVAAAYVGMVLFGAAYGLTSRPTSAAATPPVLTWNIGTARPASVGGAWSFVNSGPHVPQGFGTPTCNATTGVLTVPYLTPLTTIVGSSVMTDEDWSREGIMVGASVGTTYTDLYFTKVTASGVVIQSCATIDAVGNVWIQVEGT